MGYVQTAAAAGIQLQQEPRAALDASPAASSFKLARHRVRTARWALASVVFQPAAKTVKLGSMLCLASPPMYALLVQQVHMNRMQAVSGAYNVRRGRTNPDWRVLHASRAMPAP